MELVNELKHAIKDYHYPVFRESLIWSRHKIKEKSISVNCAVGGRAKHVSHWLAVAVI